MRLQPSSQREKMQPSIQDMKMRIAVVSAIKTNSEVRRKNPQGEVQPPQNAVKDGRNA